MIGWQKARCLVFLITGLASLVYAQPRLTGSISGKIVNAEGIRLSRVAVTVEGPALQGQITSFTKQNGAFRFLGLPPGHGYTVYAEFPEYNTAIISDLAVNSRKTTLLTITLLKAELQSDEGKPAEDVSAIDSKSSTTSVGFSRSFIVHAPLMRDLHDIFQAMPGAFSDDSSHRRTIFASGGTALGHQYSLDGTLLNDPLFMHAATNVSLDVLEEVDFGLFGHEPNVGVADGGFVNIITRSGGNHFTGSLSAEYYDSSMQESLLPEEELRKEGFEETTSHKSWRDLSLSLGGPLLTDYTWYFVNLHHSKHVKDFRHTSWERTQESGNRVFVLDEAPHNEFNIFGKLTSQITSTIRLSASYNLSSVSENLYTDELRNNYDKSATCKWDGEQTQILNARVSYSVNENFFVEGHLGYLKRSFPTPYSQYALSDQPRIYDVFYDVFTNNPPYNQVYSQKRFTPSVTGTYFADNILGTSHEIRFGAEYEESKSEWDFWRQNPFFFHYNKGNIYAYPNAETPQRTLLFAYPCSPEEGGSVQRNRLSRIGAFVQDNITIKDRITLSFGLRFDTSRGAFPAQFHSASADSYNILEKLPGLGIQYQDYAAAKLQVLNWTHLSPRIGLSFDIFGNGKSVINASYSRYYEYLMLQYFNRLNFLYPQPGSWYWIDTNNDMLPDADDSYEVISVPLNPQGFALDAQRDRNASAPFTDEFTWGIQAHLAKNFSASATLIYRHKKNIFDDVNDYGRGKEEAWTGYSENSPYWERFDFLDPGEDGEFGTGDDLESFCYVELSNAPSRHQYFMNVPEGFRKYSALQVTLFKRMSHNWQLLASLAWSKSWGNINGSYNEARGVSESFNTPNTFVFSGGRLDYDRPLNIKILGSIQFLKGFVLSAYFRYLSGKPWTRTVTVYVPEEDKYLHPGGAYTVLTERSGGRRTNPLAALDLRLEKQIRVSDALSIGGYIDVLNALGKGSHTISSNPGGFLDYRDPNNPVFERYGTFVSIEEFFANRVYKASLRLFF